MAERFAAVRINKAHAHAHIRMFTRRYTHVNASAPVAEGCIERGAFSPFIAVGTRLD